MKDYHEMAESVLYRRDKYVIERRKQTKKTVATLSCFCLCTLLGVGAWQLGMFDRKLPSNTSETTDIGENIGGSGMAQEKTQPSLENYAQEKQSSEMDSIGWLIWQGREYVQQGTSLEEKEKLDQYLGVVTEFEGCYQNNGDGGSLYTVKDSDTLLCVKLDNGAYIYLSCSKENSYDAPVQNEAGNTGALEVPGDRDWGTVWGGSYLAENGNWVVWLTEDTTENRAEVFQRNPSLDENSTTFKKAEYSLEYLTKIMTGISRAMGDGRLPTVSTAALREDLNRVQVTMNNASSDESERVLAFDDLGGAIEVITGSTASTEEKLTQKEIAQ